MQSSFQTRVFIANTFFYTKLRASGCRGVERWIRNVRGSCAQQCWCICTCDVHVCSQIRSTGQYNLRYMYLNFNMYMYMYVSAH